MRIRLSTKNQYLQNHLTGYFSAQFDEDFILSRNLKNPDFVMVDTNTCSISDIHGIRIPLLLYAMEIKPFLLEYFETMQVSGVFTFSMSPEKIKETINAISSNDVFFDEEVLSIIFSKKANSLSKKITSLTLREMEIIQLTLDDMTNTEIAERLKLSIRTVNAHKGNISRKIGTKTTTGLIKILYDYSSEFRMIF